MRMPLAYDTPLGEGGVGLSGGERQRLSIARALLFDSPILVLDEATASVDAESERAICEAIRRGSSRRTTILIAHRLSTLQDADRLFVFDQGRLVEQGTHAELLARGGLYDKLARLQGNRDPRRPSRNRDGDYANRQPPWLDPRRGRRGRRRSAARDGRRTGVVRRFCGAGFPRRAGRSLSLPAASRAFRRGARSRHDSLACRVAAGFPGSGGAFPRAAVLVARGRRDPSIRGEGNRVVLLVSTDGARIRVELTRATTAFTASARAACCCATPGGATT